MIEGPLFLSRDHCTCMEQADTSWHGVVQVAWVYLGRYRDPMTRSLRDEIAQEAAVLCHRFPHFCGALCDAWGRYVPI